MQHSGACSIPYISIEDHFKAPCLNYFRINVRVRTCYSMAYKFSKKRVYYTGNAEMLLNPSLIKIEFTTTAFKYCIVTCPRHATNVEVISLKESLYMAPIAYRSTTSLIRYIYKVKNPNDPVTLLYSCENYITSATIK